MNAGERLMGAGLRILGRVASSGAVDRLGLRDVSEHMLRSGTRNGFRAVGALGRGFKAVSTLTHPARAPKRAEPGLFDPTPDEEQQMLADAVRDFALEQLRPAASAADAACRAEDDLLQRAAALGIASMSVPEALGGAASQRSAVGGVLITEALAQGDAGLAVACLAPVAVATALALWGSAEQQAAYLPALTGDTSAAAALALLEARPLFDPFALQTRAQRRGNGYVIEGAKALIPRVADAEFFIVAAELENEGPRLFVVESDIRGLSLVPTPAMGLRAAACGRLELKQLSLPAGAMLGGDRAGNDAAVAADHYTRCVHLARLGWCALAVGVAQAALDYVVPYVNERTAFGEPISHRQGVAFAVADMAIDLESMRLLTRRAASRAEQGLPFAREAALARSLCADKGAAIGSTAVQMLGGHGFVKEHPVERWYRDLRAVGLMEGALLI